MSMLRRRMMMGQGGSADYSQMYLTFKALESGTFSFSRNAISYSLDGGSTWTSLPASTATPTIAAGQEICWKASGLTPATSNGIGTFSSTGLFDAFGNVMSIVAGDDFETATTMASYHFSRLFYQNAKIVDASNLILPATPTTYCYYTMFMGCTALTNAPKLPATTLAGDCYEQMFRGCTALTNAPELPATRLAGTCYYRMFYGCSQLNYIKCLATNISALNALYQWLLGVASTGTFVKDASMSSWPSGDSGIPSGWTVQDAA